MQHHYFLNTEHKDSDFFEFTDYFLAKPYTFKSCSDIFSKDTFDYGSTLLLWANTLKTSPSQIAI